MSKMPKVLVVTRTKDRLLFLERALRSVQLQTMTDFVQVVINDGGEQAPVDELTKKYNPERIRVIHNKASKGMEAATNKAVKSVESEYIAIHDDDDTWHPEFLEQTVKLLDESGAMGIVVRTDKVTEAVVDNRIKILKTEPWMPDMKVINLYRQCIDNQMTPITFIYRRKVLDEIGYYDESLPVLGDWDFGLRFLQKYDVEFLDPGYALAFYHHRRYIEGVAGNTNFGNGHEKHRYYTNRILNKLLRQELAEGRLGAGYIMSQLRYERSYNAKLVQKALPGFVAKRLKHRVQD